MEKWLFTVTQTVEKKIVVRAETEQEAREALEVSLFDGDDNPYPLNGVERNGTQVVGMEVSNGVRTNKIADYDLSPIGNLKRSREMTEHIEYILGELKKNV